VKIQLLSDLHLETEAFDPQPLPEAELLVLAGDIDATWAGFGRFAHWPVPTLFVAGNHEFDGREITDAWPALRAQARRFAWTMLECETWVLTDCLGQKRAAAYFMRVMRSSRRGRDFDAAGVREEALACRAWLEDELRRPANGRWDKTVVVTHFAPSIRSADVRYGAQPGTASFCNADDDLLPHADLWIHGHLHCRHDYRVERPQGAPTRVVCQARGLQTKGEAVGYDPGKLIEI
jgi:hypothetical protein